MLNFSSTLKVYLAVEYVDMRLGYNGLSGKVEDKLKDDPCSGALFIFCNKRRNRLKCLYFDGTGLWVFAKFLSQGTFSWPKGVDAKDKLSLTPEALNLLLSGIDMKDACMRPWYQR